MSLKTVTGLLFLLLSFPLWSKEKLPFIRFHVDVAWNPVLNMQMHQLYQGEFYPDGQLPVVEWSEVDKRQKLIPGYSYWNIGGHFGTSFQNGIYVGIRYNIMQINGLEVPGLSAGPFLDVESSFFFLYSIQAGYIWRPLKDHPQWTVMPLAGVGSYFANDYFTGSGRKWMLNAQVKTTYLFKERYGLFLSPGFATWQHKDKGYSNTFERNTLDRIRLQQWYLEAGFSFLIHIDRKP
jgi:hypothetical protein